jgi:predicted phosphoribosyltransferase
MFTNRTEAGVQMATRLKKFKDQEGVILAVPRGGVPVAYGVATELEMPLDLLLTKKIGHPVNREYAIGAVSLNDSFIVPQRGISRMYIDREIKTIQERLRGMYRKFMDGKKPEPVEGRTVIIIDDGIATGDTLLGSINMLRKENPSKIIVAVPVASRGAVQRLSNAVDELIVLLIPDEFHGVGEFYEDFDQVTDDEVVSILNKWKSKNRLLDPVL